MKRLNRRTASLHSPFSSRYIIFELIAIEIPNRLDMLLFCHSSFFFALIIYSLNRVKFNSLMHSLISQYNSCMLLFSPTVWQDDPWCAHYARERVSCVLVGRSLCFSLVFCSLQFNARDGFSLCRRVQLTQVEAGLRWPMEMDVDYDLSYISHSSLRIHFRSILFFSWALIFISYFPLSVMREGH